MRALFVCFTMLFAQCATAAVTINIFESGGDVQAVLTGTLNLSATEGLVSTAPGHNSFSAALGVVGFTNGSTEYYNIDVGAWTPFGTGGTAQWDSSSGDAFTMFTGCCFVGVPTGYISGNALSATASKNGTTFAVLGFTTGSYVTTLTNNQITDTVTVIIGAAAPPTYSVGGTVSGLTGTGLALQNNGGDTLAVAAAATAFTFATELPDLATYAVTVSTQPTGQTCSVTNGSGKIATADVTNVSVACIDNVVTPPPTPMVPVPTMSEWALILLTMLIGLMVFANRRQLFE